MRLKVAGENLFETAALALGIAPVTLVDTHMSMLRARSIITATRLGIFDALASGPLDAASVAATCGTAAPATRHLLNALTGAGYLQLDQGRYTLGDVPRKWLLADAPKSLRDKVLFEAVEWTLIEGLDEFVRTGRAHDIHSAMTPEQWEPYQRAMRALAGLVAPEIVRRVPIPGGATRMLDIGGSHGFISVALCRKYPALSAVVLDLPAAVAQAAPILAREEMGDRVVHRAGDALNDELGTSEWDFVYVSQLLHHFDEPTCRELVSRIARSLKAGGILAVAEIIRPKTPTAAGQVGALLDLYFALTSQSGTWTVADLAGWQSAAGLTTEPPIWLRTGPGAAVVVGRKDH